MNRTYQKKNILIGITLIIVILFSFMVVYYASRPNRVGMIPEDDIVAILAEVYITDGLLSLPEIRTRYGDADSILNYINVIEDHGYAREDMERTMRYYFTNKPKKLITIYDKVMLKLSEMESMVDKQIPADRTHQNNEWIGDSVYLFPDAARDQTLMFDQSFVRSQYYSLIFTLTLFPDDPSLNPRFTAYFCHPDSIETGTRDYLPSLKYIKDGQPYEYMFSKRPVNESYTHLRGWFIDYDNNFEETLHHLRIENIIFTSNPLIR